MIKLDVDNYCQNCDYFEPEVNTLDLNISCPKFKPCVDYEMMYIYHNAKEDSIRRK